MTRDDDFTGLLERYLDEYEGSTPLPGPVRDAVRDRLPSTMQRPAWWPERRFTDMSNMTRIALASAAVVAAALIGLNVLLGGQNVGAPGIEDPPPTPTPSATPVAVSLDVHPNASLAAGAYFVTVADHRISFMVPSDGWQKNVVPQMLWTGNSEARVGFMTVENIYADPCQPELGEQEPPPGATAADLASALGELPGVDAASSPVEVSGYSGYLVTLDVPDAFGDCIETGGEALLSSEAPLEPGRHRFWILDVGEIRIVIVAVDRDRALPRQVDEMDAIVGSMRIEEP